MGTKLDEIALRCSLAVTKPCSSRAEVTLQNPARIASSFERDMGKVKKQTCHVHIVAAPVQLPVAADVVVDGQQPMAVTLPFWQQSSSEGLDLC